MSGVPSVAGPLRFEPLGPVRFELLGPLRALRDGAELDLGPAKQRAVLATLLVCAGRPVPTGQIVDAVWGDAPPENGANVVQKYVAGLRRVLDPDRSPRTPGELLALTSAGYQLHVGAGALDVEAFEAGLARATRERAEGRLTEAAATLRHALGLYRGVPLAGLAGSLFDTARDRLLESQATAWEQWADVELARGRHSVLVPDLVRLVAEFPMREGLRAAHMLALHRGGRQAEALAAFRETRRYLSEEFGVEPGERLQELYRRILRADVSLLAPADADQPMPAPAPPATAADLGATVPGAASGPAVPSPAAPDVADVWAAPGAAASGSAAHSPAAPHPAAPGSAVPGPAAPGSGAPGHAAPGIAVAGPANPGPAAAGPGPGPARPASTAPGGVGAPHHTTVAGYADGEATVDHHDAIWPSVRHPAAERPVGPGLQVAAAIAVPLATCGIGSWAFLLYLAAVRRDRISALAAVGYFLAAVGAFIGIVLSEGDPSDTTDAVIISLLMLSGVGGAVHAGILSATATRHGDHERAQRREQARQIIYHQPAVARMLGIGRPDLPRWYDDGGLIDINHVPAAVLASLPGVDAAAAHRLVQDRQERGLFRNVDDVVARGLLPAAVVHRAAARLLCLGSPAADPNRAVR